MGWLNNLLLIAQVVSALGVIVLVLMQHGKGADMGAAFGSGSSGSLFGASGSASFLSRTTGVLATLFFVCTLALALLSNQRPEAPASIMEGASQVPAQPQQPASDVPPGPPADIPPVGPGAASAPAGAGTRAAPAAGADAASPAVPVPESGPANPPAGGVSN